MKVFVVATPVFDTAMNVVAYRMCDRSGDSVLDTRVGHGRMASALQSPGLDLVDKVGIETFTAGEPLFVELNRFQLMAGAPFAKKCNPAQLICTLPGGLPNDDELLRRCGELRQRGYVLALDDFPLSGVQSPYLDYVDYLVLNYNNPRFSSCVKAINAQLPRVRVVIAGVPDRSSYYKLSSHRTAWFSGDFYNQPVSVTVSQLSPVKANALHLLSQVNQPDFDLTESARIIGQDPALSISLLRFINSQAVGLKNKVDSIQSAVAILGQEEMRRWASVAISVSLAEDRPGEITRLSLVRAKFAEGLAGAFELGIFQRQLFLSGLFSLLDVILQKPMVEAVKEVAVDDRVRQTLVDRSGVLFPVLDLIYAYERADWDKVSRIMIQHGTDVETISNAFVDALIWYEQLLSSIEDEPA